MRPTICVSAAVLCAICAHADAKSISHAKRQLSGTTWAYVEDGERLRMSIDHSGHYTETTTNGKVVGRGTATMKGAKDCFTPVKSTDGEHCWTSEPLEVGQSMISISDKGERLKVTRVK